MNAGSARYGVLLRLLDEALDLSAPERAEWLARLPDSLSDLRPTLRRMLLTAHAVEADEHIGLPVRIGRVLHEAISRPDAPNLIAGEHIGPYELVREIGRGGMGIVWLANRADGAFQRSVALKLPHVSWSETFSERIGRERDILAGLEHPNIARFYDAGFDGLGRPYMAMEYVEGQAINLYCQARQLPLRDRLSLVLDVTKAVSYAHAKLVVHRDLKPANILVTTQGEVRLLDFGIAKIIDPQDQGGDRLTQLSGQLLTPDYASPEQIRGESIGTATDVYSLAVVTFELLTGNKPYHLKRQSAAELAHAIAEHDPQLASESVNDKAHRRQMRGDLDAILNKAMKKSPGDRYATVAAFGDDLERHLTSVPVIARADRFGYRARKFIRRNVWQVGAASLILLAILAGSVIALWQARSARIEAARADATKVFLINIFRSNDTRIAADKPHAQRTVKEVLDAATARIGADFAGQPDMQIELLGLTAKIYENYQDMPRYHELQRQRMEVARATYGPTHPAVIEGLLEESDAALAQVDGNAAAALLAEADIALKRSDADGGELRADWLRIKSRLLHRTASNQDEADRLLDQAIALYQKIGSNQMAYAEALNMRARVQSDHGDPTRALPLMQQAIQIAESAPDRDDAMLSTFIINLARHQADAGNAAAAETTYHRAADLARMTKGVHHRNFWIALAWQAQLLHYRGEIERGHALFAQMLGNLPSTTGDYNADLARQVYAECLVSEGNAREAVPILEQVYKTYLAHAAYEYEVREIRRSLGEAYDGAGRVADARVMLQASYEEFIEKEAPSSPWVLRIRERWGRFLLDHGQPGDADYVAAEEQFNAVAAQTGHPPMPFDAMAQAGLARIALSRGDIVAARVSSNRALELIDRVQSVFDVRTRSQLWLVRSAVLLQDGEAGEANRWAKKARDASIRLDAPSSPSIVLATAAMDRATDGAAR